MGRTGEDESKKAQQDSASQQAAAFNTGQGALQSYMQRMGMLDKGINVSANPWENPSYLASQNRLTSGSLDQATNAGKSELRDIDRRTGGVNTGATRAGITGLSLAKARMADQLTAQRESGDYLKNVAYQGEMARAPLAVAEGESPYYGTATTGRDSALNNLTQFGLASYGPWQSLISAAGGAAAGALSKKA